MNTHVAGFQSFSGFLHHFVLAKLANSSIRDTVLLPKPICINECWKRILCIQSLPFCSRFTCRRWHCRLQGFSTNPPSWLVDELGDDSSSGYGRFTPFVGDSKSDDESSNDERESSKEDRESSSSVAALSRRIRSGRLASWATKAMSPLLWFTHLTSTTPESKDEIT